MGERGGEMEVKKGECVLRNVGWYGGTREGCEERRGTKTKYKLVRKGEGRDKDYRSERKTRKWMKKSGL